MYWLGRGGVSEDGYQCLRDALTISRGDKAPRSVKALRKALADAGHTAASINEALASWAGSVVTRLTDDKTER